MNMMANSEATTIRAPEGLHSLVAGSRKRLDQRNRCDRTADHTKHRRTPDVVARRLLRELAFDEVEIVCELITAGATHNERVGGMKE